MSYLHVLRVFGNVAAHAEESGGDPEIDLDDRDVSILLVCLQRVVEFWRSFRVRRGG